MEQETKRATYHQAPLFFYAMVSGQPSHQRPYLRRTEEVTSPCRQDGSQ